MTGGPSLELWVEERDGAPAVNPVMRALLALLAEDGLACRAVVPEHVVAGPDWQPPDVVLLKSPTPLALSRAVVAEAAGACVLNGALPTRAAHDKAGVVGALAAAGLPVPETWLGAPPAAAGRWVVKPPLGVHGRGVRFADGPLDPAAAAWQLVQRRIGGDEADIKVYVAGDHVFAGRKRFSATSFTSDAIEPITLARGADEAVRAAGAVLGLRLFGADVREDAAGRPHLIDVNPFPGYRGFPAAAIALAAEVRAVLVAA